MLKFFRSKTQPEYSDEQLLELYLRTDDTRHLGTLYDRYLPMVFGVCLKIVKDRSQAEDAVMSIFEELILKVRLHKIESFRGWLYVLARNHCLMDWRKKQRRPANSLPPEDMAKFDAPQDDIDFELTNDTNFLQKCLEKLNDIQRKCVAMFYFDDNSYKEIADSLVLEVGLVRSHIQNGKRNLRICLEKMGKTTVFET